MNTVRDALIEATQMLSSLDTPFLDATLLLAHTLGISKEKLLASYPESLSLSAQNEFRGYLKQRLSGYPVSYIRNKKEFLGLPFYVDNRVLVPRPETETLVELVMEHTDTMKVLRARARSDAENHPSVPDTPAQGKSTPAEKSEAPTEGKSVPASERNAPGAESPVRVLDLGTGSGCIAISLKYLRPGLDVTASDASKGALKVCELNGRHLLSDPLPLFHSNLFDEIEGRFDIIASNPPYLTDSEVAEMERNNWPEPRMALVGGEDGLDLIRIIIDQAPQHLNDDGYIFLEAHIYQIESIKQLLTERGYTQVRAYQDLTGRDRVVRGKKPYAEPH